MNRSWSTAAVWLATLVGSSSGLWAGGPGPCTPPPCDCTPLPPTAPPLVAPQVPGRTGEPSAEAPPVDEVLPPPANADQFNPLAGANPQGPTARFASRSTPAAAPSGGRGMPNLFGDSFGTSCATFTYGNQTGLQALTTNDTVTFAAPSNLVTTGPDFIVQYFTPTSATFRGQPLPSFQLLATVTNPTTGTFPVILPTGEAASIATVDGITMAVQQGFDASIPAGDIPGTATLLSGTLTNGNAATAEFNYVYTYQQIILLPDITFMVCSPADGGVVGRQKISEDNNPWPRDRILFNYDYFNSVPLGSNERDVRRFVPGIEKTFLSGNMSLEARFPMASTLSSDLALDPGTGDTIGSTDTELGNIMLTFKSLLYTNERWAFSGGLAVGLPTGSDTSVTLAGRELIRIENESVILQPFFAAGWQPNDRLFSQTWFSYSFDTSGSPVAVNTAGAGLATIGRLDARSVMSLDWQLGYWVIRNECNTLRGLAPFVELHYNTTTGDQSRVASGSFRVEDANDYDELNLTTGVTSIIGDGVTASLGVVTPLTGEGNRFFDSQIGFRLNYYYGYGRQ